MKISTDTELDEERRFRFSKERLANLPVPKDGPVTYYDKDVKQLGLRLQPSGRGVYFVLKKVAGKPYRKTLGDRNYLQLDAARKHAHAVLAAVADWLAGDRKEANPMLRPIEGEDRLTFEAAFEMYLRSPRPRVHPDKRAKADKRVRYIMDSYLGTISNREVTELDTHIIGALHVRLTKEHGPVAANRAHEVVRAVFNFLISKGLWNAVNPSKGAQRNPEEDCDTILEPHQLNPFYDAMDAEENRDFAEFVGLLLATGCRKGNLYSCEWDEVDRRAGTWTIPHEKYKNGKTTALTLSPVAITLFNAREARLLKKGTKDARWVFPSKAGAKCGHVVDYKNQFARLKKAAGLKKFTMHDLRRTFVAAMVSSGKASMPVISAAAGHSSIDSMKPYAKFAKQAVNDALSAGVFEIAKQRKDAEAQAKADAAVAKKKTKRLPAA